MNATMNASTIVITGASSGIGRALALELASRGHTLGLTARRLPLLKTLRAEIQAAHGTRVEIAALDVSDTDQVAPRLGKLFATLGGADVVVVNAGINAMTQVGKGTLAQELQILQTNVAGAIATVHAAAAHFIERGQGHVVGISSIAALQGVPKQAAYCASKAAFAMYLDCARMELGRKGIAVSNIRPGYISTDLVDGVDIGKLPFAVSAEKGACEMADLIEKRVPDAVVPAWPWKLMRPALGHIPTRFL
jgi:short-subunit dehydrogenase